MVRPTKAKVAKRQQLAEASSVYQEQLTLESAQAKLTEAEIQIESLKSSLQELQDRYLECSACCQKQGLLDSAQEELAGAEIKIQSLESSLQDRINECSELSSQLEISLHHSEELSLALKTEKARYDALYKKLRVERRARQRGQNQKSVLKEQMSLLLSAGAGKTAEENAAKALSSLLHKEKAIIEKENAVLRSELSQCLTRCKSEFQSSQEKLIQAGKKLKASQSLVNSLQKQCRSNQKRQQHAVTKAREQEFKERSVHRLLHKGVYTEETRNLIRLLVKAGCSRGYVGQVISAVLKSAGITAIGNISRCTVSRVITEGYFAAQIQLGHEMKNAESMTFSADGTSHRSINYNSRHVNLKAETYEPGSQRTERVTCFFGICSTLDGSSEEAMKEWDKLLETIIALYNRSPFGKRNGHFLTVIEILIKLVGMHSDHCTKEKRDAKLMEIKKLRAVYQSLGEDALIEKSCEELLAYFEEAEKDKFKAAGGQAKWNSLSDEEQKERTAVAMENLVIKLGKDAYDMMSDEEKGIMKLFIWAGCGCHKDLNTVRGGYAAMKNWWAENQVEPPVLLANRDNAVVLDEISEERDTITPAQQRALERTTGGAIIAVQIAGAIFNHQHDKKGYHDVFHWWFFERLKITITFPDTSNNRFQSYCNAAAVLILYLDIFIEFLEFIRNRKQKKRFSHMEENLWNALHCQATKTELAVLAMYAQVISHPYMTKIRASDQVNALDLGPLHKAVHDHMTCIIENPSLILGPTATYETGALNGEKWESQVVFDTVRDMAPDLPHLEPVLVRFFQGASIVWKKFMSEYAPRGLIDEASTEEKDLAWMPPTNDVNEGALGAFRVLIRRQPLLTELQYNAQAMFHHNNTKAFMEKHFGPEDYKFIHGLARQSSGHERERKRAIIEHTEKKIELRLQKTEKRLKIAAERALRVANTKLVLTKEGIDATKGQKLKDLVQALKLEPQML